MAGRSGRASRSTATIGRNPVIPSNSLVASAVGFSGDVRMIFRGQTEWQKEAWRFYTLVPELRFAANWIGNALSRCVLEPAEIIDGKAKPTEKKVIGAALDELFAGAAGQAEMLTTLGIHMTVAGESYLVGRYLVLENADGSQSEVKVWEIIGVNELQVAHGAWLIDYGQEGMRRVQLGDRDTVIRIWRPHPAQRIEADSPVRSLLGVLSEIESLSQHMFATTISRLTGPGVWVVPDSVQFPGSEKGGNRAEGLLRYITKAMLTAQSKPEDPSSLVPITVTAPKDDVEAFKPPIHFWSEFDKQALAARSAAVLRFCVGMDIPPEVILGMTHGASHSGGTGTGASHWTAWQVEEAAIKLHIEPLLAVIGNAIVMQYLRQVTGVPTAAVMYNTTALKLQPDRSKEALEAADRGMIGSSGLLTMLGIDPAMAATDDERNAWLLARVAGASATPEQVAWALKKLTGLSDVPDGSDAGGRPLPPGTNQPPAPSLEGHPSGRGYPEAASLLMGAEAVVLRALERAGNKLKNRGLQTAQPMPAHTLHLYAGSINGDAAALLDDAWSTVPTVFAGCGVEPEQIQTTLNGYVTGLLQMKRAHSREALSRHLEAMCSAG